jgi:hypothetical protein
MLLAKAALPLQISALPQNGTPADCMPQAATRQSAPSDAFAVALAPKGVRKHNLADVSNSPSGIAITPRSSAVSCR